ncbi:unnamed protein product [Gadus morhua 'NCC']
MKMYAYPDFRRQSAQSTRLFMAASEQAKGVGKGPGLAKPKEEVMTEARNFIANNGGDPNDFFLTLAHCQLQFGMYQGQRFRWLMENNLGYALYLLQSISKESVQANPMSENKQLLLQYASQIREVKEELKKFQRKMGMQAKARDTGDEGWLMVEFGDFQGQSMKDVYEDQTSKAQKLINYLVQADARPNTNMALFRAYVLKRRASTSSTSAPPPAASTSSAPPPAASTSSEASTSPAPPPAASGTGAWKKSNVKALLASGKHLSPSTLARKLMAPVKSSPAPNMPANPRTKLQLFDACEDDDDDDDDQELISAVSQFEAQLNTALPTTVRVESCADPLPAAIPDLDDHQQPADLPAPWKDQLPRFQQEWIRRALFQANPQTGKR